jgi:Cysteine-rich secretory protein family
MDLEVARQYVLDLVNADRRAQGLLPVERDTVAERAAQEHADDMAHLGFTAHWGSDGSVPEERYTHAGGMHFVQENAACFFDAQRRALDPGARFMSSPLEQIEAAFMGEVPPHDGHRKNILKPTHTGLGIGLAQPEGLAQPCMTQEFVDVRGEYAPLPGKAALGQAVHVAGELAEPVQFGGVGLSRIEPRKRLSPQHLNDTSSYPIPAPYQSYFPEGYQTPKPVQLVGRRFSIDVSLSDRKRPGRYGVSVWGVYPDSGEQLVMVSLRIVDVR